MKTKFKDRYVPFIDSAFVNTIMMMYANGTSIDYISCYIGVSHEEVNEIIDNYNDCLSMDE